MPTVRYEVSEEAAGVLLDRFVREAQGGAPWSKVRAWIERGQVLLDGQIVRSATLPLVAGSVVEVREQGARAPRNQPALAAQILYQDSQVVVVVKPTGVSTEPYDSNEKDTLDRWLQAELGGQRQVHVVHRLDKETSGILVFARTTAAKDHLKNQFRFHTTGRRYLALVHGTPRSPRTISSQIVRDRGDGRRGSTDNSKLGRASVTHVQLLETLSGASLIECRLETGRTHQIRIHLAEAGHPLLGERIYSKGYVGRLLPAVRVMLHAETLEFDHPVRQERMRFQSDPPSDFAACLAALRGDSAPRAVRSEVDVRSAQARANVPAAKSPRARPGPHRGSRSPNHGKRKQFD